MSNIVTEYIGKHRLDGVPERFEGDAYISVTDRIERHLRLNVFCGDHYAPEDGAS